MWSERRRFPAGASRKMASLESSACAQAKAATATATIHRVPSTSLKHVPAGDSPYVQAKHVQLVEKDPNKAIPLFWAAINCGDRVDSALKDMAFVMKQVNRAEEAIEAIKSFRYLCSIQAQEPLDNVLLELYKTCGRIDDQIEMLNFKLKMVDDGLAFGGKTTKLSRSQGKRFHVSLVQEKSRLLGNLAWAYMQSDNYMEAESHYRQALAIEPDHNKQCNLAVCLMKTGRLAEAKSILHDVKETSRAVPFTNSSTESYLKSFERASAMLMTLESQSELNGKFERLQLEGHNITATASNPVNDGRSEDFNGKNLWKRESPKYVTPSETTKLNHVTDILFPKPLVQSLTASGNVSANAPSKESGSSMKASENKNQCQKSQSYEKGGQRCNDIGEEEVFSGIMKMRHPQNLDLDHNSALITESMKPAEDSSIFTSGRKRFGEPEVQNCSADVHILEPKMPIQSPNQARFGSLSTSMNVNQIQGSDVSTDTRRQIEILGEKIPQGVSNNGNSQNSDNASTSTDKIPKFGGDNPVSYRGNRTWAEMVEEEENSANENLSIDIVADHVIGSCKNSTEEHFKTLPALNNRKSWADMVEEEEYLANGNLHHSAAINSQSGSCKPTTTEQPACKGFPDENVNFKTLPSLNSRKSWADMVEEEEHLANGTLNHSAAVVGPSGSCKHTSTEQPACKGFPDENVNFKTLPSLNSRKSWADMVEEEEYLANGNLNHSAAVDSHSGSCKHTSTEQPTCKGFPDENVNFINIIRSTPCQNHQMPQNHTARFCKKLSILDMKEGPESGSKTPRRNWSARRSLSFDQHPKWNLSKDCFPEAGLQDSLQTLKRAKRRNRLRIFQEITLDNNARD